MVKSLLYKHEDLNWNLRLYMEKPGMVLRACSLGTGEAETGRSPRLAFQLVEPPAQSRLARDPVSAIMVGGT